MTRKEFMELKRQIKSNFKKIFNKLNIDYNQKFLILFKKFSIIIIFHLNNYIKVIKI